MITSRACIFRVPRSWPSSETQFSDTGVNVPNSVIPSPPATPKKKYSDSVNLLYVPPPPFIAGSRRHSPRTHAESSMITPAFYVLHLQHLSRLPSSVWDFVVTRWKWHQMLGAYTRASCPFLWWEWIPLPPAGSHPPPAPTGVWQSRQIGPILIAQSACSHRFHLQPKWIFSDFPRPNYGLAVWDFWQRFTESWRSAFGILRFAVADGIVAWFHCTLFPGEWYIRSEVVRKLSLPCRLDRSAVAIATLPYSQSQSTFSG